ncbi:unnamed protein product [Closterium sp. NIES-53]
MRHYNERKSRHRSIRRVSGTTSSTSHPPILPSPSFAVFPPSSSPTPGAVCSIPGHGAEEEQHHGGLCAAYLDTALKESNITEYRQRIQRAILSLAFYWYNFMPLARGTAMVGYVTMLGLFLAADMQVTAHVPRGLQADWEGILSPRLDSFIGALSPWLIPSIDYNCSALNNLPSVPVTESLSSLLDIINALSFYDQPAPPITWPRLN